MEGKAFIEWSPSRHEVYSDTLILCLPHIGRLPSLINKVEEEFANLILEPQADERDVIHKNYTVSECLDYTNPEIIPWDTHVIIRYWWD